MVPYSHYLYFHFHLRFHIRSLFNISHTYPRGMSRLISISRHARSAARGQSTNLNSLRGSTPSSHAALRVPLYSSLRPFSTTLRAMAGTKIDGTAIAKTIRQRIAGEIKQMQETNPRYKPSLTIVQGAHPPFTTTVIHTDAQSL